MSGECECMRRCGFEVRKDPCACFWPNWFLCHLWTPGPPNGERRPPGWHRAGYSAFWIFSLASSEVWGLGREITGDLSYPAPPSLCLATWGRAGLGFWPTGVLNASAPPGSAWGLCLSRPGLQGPREEGDGSLDSGVLGKLWKTWSRLGGGI